MCAGNIDIITDYLKTIGIVEVDVRDVDHLWRPVLAQAAVKLQALGITTVRYQLADRTFGFVTVLSYTKATALGAPSPTVPVPVPCS